MSKYTTEVRYICETLSGFTVEELKNKTVDEIIAASRTNVFNFDFPVYEEAFRGVVESAILLHFYTREIGAETVGLWQHYLCRKLREIMPRYNKLFLSSLLEFDPLHDVDYTKTHKGESTGDKYGTHTRTGNGSSTHSNTVVTDGTVVDTDHGTSAETTSGNTTSSNSDSRTDNTTTSGERDVTRNGTKTTHDEHTRDNTHKDYYSDTPMTKVEGVNGMPVMTGDTTLGYNYYLTNYRKVTDAETGDNDGMETQDETVNEDTSGTSRTTSTGSATGSGTTEGTRDVTTSATGNTKTDTEVTDDGTTTSTDSESGNTTESFENTDDYVEHIVGKMGTASYSSMILEYRETIVNYMEALLDELEPLFMNIW